MESVKGDVVTAETLIRQVEALLVMDDLSEGEKVDILRKVLSILEEK